MVRFIIDYEYVAHTHQVWHHALEHLPLGFQGIEFFTTSPLQEQSAPFR
jgi:hypothetical protein